MLRYKYINHTADLGIKIYGRTKPELFKNGAAAVFETMLQVKTAYRFKRLIEYRLDLESNSSAELLVDWLREILYNFYVKHVVPQRYVIKFRGNHRLVAVVTGSRFKLEFFKMKMEIKNVTYHNLKIRKNSRGYTATVIFDV